MAEILTEPSESAEKGSTFIVALHVLMWTNLCCGLIALMVVVLLTR